MFNQINKPMILKIIRLYEAKDVITKMYLRNKLQTLKMGENEFVTKHIHTFRSLLEQLFVVRSLVVDEDVLSLMGNMPINYKIFISSLKR